MSPRPEPCEAFEPPELDFGTGTCTRCGHLRWSHPSADPLADMRDVLGRVRRGEIDIWTQSMSEDWHRQFQEETP